MGNEDLGVRVRTIIEDSSVGTLSALLNDSDLIKLAGFQTSYEGGAKHCVPISYKIPEFAQAILPKVEKVNSQVANMLKSIILSSNDQILYQSAIN